MVAREVVIMNRYHHFCYNGAFRQNVDRWRQRRSLQASKRPIACLARSSAKCGRSPTSSSFLIRVSSRRRSARGPPTRSGPSDIRLWNAWCRRSGASAGRANGDIVAGYVRALSGLDHESPAAKLTPTRAPATIARYLVHIGWAYRMAGREDPTAAPWCGSRLRQRESSLAHGSVRPARSATRAMWRIWTAQPPACAGRPS